AADYRHVVGTVDGDGDELAGAAVAGDRGKGVGDRLAGAELLGCAVAVFGRVCPAAVVRRRERAVAVAAQRAGLRREIVLPGIHVADLDHAADAAVTGHHTHSLHDALPIYAADYRHVVGTVDGDGDELAGAAVAGDRRKGVGDRLAGAQLLDRALAVIGRVSPAAVRRQRERAVAVAAQRAGLRREIGLPGIHVADAERAAGGDVA